MDFSLAPLAPLELLAVLPHPPPPSLLSGGEALSLLPLGGGVGAEGGGGGALPLLPPLAGVEALPHVCTVTDCLCAFPLALA